jgi:hypothetical protein
MHQGGAVSELVCSIYQETRRDDQWQHLFDAKIVFAFALDRYGLTDSDLGASSTTYFWRKEERYLLSVDLNGKVVHIIYTLFDLNDLSLFVGEGKFKDGLLLVR